MAGEPLGLIAGNGRFPFLAAAGARRAGRRVVALAIREEASPELEREVDEIHWIGLGQLGRGISILRSARARARRSWPGRSSTGRSSRTSCPT